MAITITLMVVALAAGYIGARIERKRSSYITKREATKLRRDMDEMKAVFNEHWDVHKVLKYQVEGLAKDILMVGQYVGLEEAHSATEKLELH